MFDYLYRREMEGNMDDKFEQEEMNILERLKKRKEDRIKKSKEEYYQFKLTEIEKKTSLEEAARKLAHT